MVDAHSSQEEHDDVDELKALFEEAKNIEPRDEKIRQLTQLAVMITGSPEDMENIDTAPRAYLNEPSALALLNKISHELKQIGSPTDAERIDQRLRGNAAVTRSIEFRQKRIRSSHGQFMA